MFKLVFIHLILIFGINILEASTKEECTTIDNRPVSTRSWEPQDQGKTPWCGAFSFTRALSYMNETELSSFSTALEYIRFYRSQELKRDSWFHKAIKLINPTRPDYNSILEISGQNFVGLSILSSSNGYMCIASSLRSGNSNINVEFNQAIEEIQSLYAQLQSTDVSLSSLSSEQCQKIQSLFQKSVKEFFPGLKLDYFIKTLLDQTKAQYLINELADYSCEKKMISPFRYEYSINNQDTSDKHFINNSIDNSLEHGGLSIIEANTSFKHRSPYKKSKATHGLLVYGRQWNDKDKKCYYKIENSWGKTCRYIPPGSPIICHQSNGHLEIPLDVLGNLSHASISLFPQSSN